MHPPKSCNKTIQKKQFVSTFNQGLDVYLKKIFYKGIVVPDLIGFKSDVVKEV
jgi:hypothetical protein